MQDAIIYGRFSPRPDADTSTSNEKQEERCRLYASKKDYNVIAVFLDRDITGAIFNRPELEKALDYLRQHQGTILIVDDHERMARDTLVALTIKKEVQNAKCTIEFADGSPGLSDNEEEILLSEMLCSMSAYRRRKIARKTKEELAKKMANGQWIGKPPFGYEYDRNSKKLVPCLYEQECMKYIRRLYDTGVVKATHITKIMNKKYGKFRNGPWTIWTVRKILKKFGICLTGKNAEL